MPIIPGVPTADGRKFFSQFHAGLCGIPASTTIVTPGPTTVQWNPLYTYFKVGEGGWINPGSGKVPRTPDATLRRFAPDPLIQDLDAIVDAYRGTPRYNGNTADPTYSRGVFQKALVPGDVTFESPTTARIRCLLDFSDFNEDSPGSGRNPEIWEIGIFTDHPQIVTPAPAGQLLMIGYGTFPMQTKNSGIQIENIVRITF